jgi:hypothetical protein
MAAAKSTEAPKYLMQSGTGDIWHYTPLLATRPDMHPYDEELFGAVKDGKSGYLDKKKEEAEAEKAEKEAKDREQKGRAEAEKDEADAEARYRAGAAKKKE